MARLSTYAIDGTPVSSDKLIGTDSAGTVTKNYPLGDVADWLKSSGATAVLGQNNYLFQIALDPDEGRKIGSFSFENYGGDGTAFEDVTNLKFSASSSAGKYIADYLLSTVDQKIMLSQLDDPNSFGIYVLASLVQSPLEPTFYDATLAVVSSNGVLRGNKSYGLATYSALNEAGGGTWGSITGTITNQTDLVDYIDAEIAAIPVPATPTLQSVTDAGAITTNDITTGSITSNGNFLITGTGSTVQLRGSSVDFDIQTTAADNVARIATTTGGSGRLELYNHISGFNGALEFRATSWENDALVISGGTPNTTKFLVSRDPNAATLQVTGESYFTGNVGIGTTAPTEKLEVVGYAKASTGFKFGNYGLVYEAANDVNIKNAAYYHINFHTNNAQRMRITNAGNVGIGTTAPNSLLHVARTSNGEVLRLQDTTNANQNYVFETEATGSFYGLNLKNSSTGDTIVNFSANGKLGIKTNNPDKALTINETADNDVQIKIGNHFGIGYSQAGQTRSVIGSTYGNDAAMMSFVLGGYTTASDKMTILGSGNVGIGTTAPLAKLHIKDGNTLTTALPNTSALIEGFSQSILQVASHSTGYSQLAFGDQDDGFDGGLFYSNASRYLAIEAANAEQMRFTSDGKVGIGTTAPVEKVHINGNLRIGLIGNTGYYISWGQNEVGSTGDFARIQGIRTSGAGNQAGHLTFQTKPPLSGNSPTERLRITDTGNVGIGTTAPASKFHINADNNDTAMGMRISNQNLGGRAGFTFHLPNNNNQYYSFGVDNDRNFKISESNNLNTNNLFTFTPSGNVGIGTTSPSEKLEVAGNIRAYASTGTVTIGTEKDGNYARLNSDGTSGYISYGNVNGASRVLRFVGNSSEVARFDSSGNVGIGTTAPAAKLDVVGTIKLDDGGGSVYVGNAAGYNDDKTFNYNVGIGDNALAANTGGNNNIAVGSYALYNPTNTSGNIAIGGSALGDTTTGYRNTAVGHLAHSLNTSGYENVAIGHNALGSATSPYQSVAVGSYALGNANGVASDNTGIGYYAMSLLTTGRYNTSLGTYALSDTVLGSNNTAVGYYAGGGDYQGTNSVYLGMNTAPNSDNETNQVVIGYGATGNGSNSVTIGNTSITKTIMREGVGVGVTSPASSMHIGGAAMRQLRINTPGGPTSSADTAGNIGDIAYDDLYFYIKTTNGWGRVPLDFGF